MNLYEYNTYGNIDRALLHQNEELVVERVVSIIFGMGMSILSCHLEVRD